MLSQEESKDSFLANFEDPEFQTNHYLRKTDAIDRATAISNVGYKLSISLKKGGGTYHGKVEITYNQTKILEDFKHDDVKVEGGHLFIDYKGKRVKTLKVNGTFVTKDFPHVYKCAKIFVPASF